MRNSKTNNLAPVAIFVYNRLKNTKEVIEALKENYFAQKTDIFIFSDAPKTNRQKKAVKKVRTFIKTITGFKSVSIIERDKNFYIEKNIISGVTKIVEKYGRIIVLEDDGVTAKYFLTFMNNALDFYVDTKRVMHIATFTFIQMPKNYRKTFFWQYSENTGGGWATWSDRWSKFKYFTNENDALDSLTLEQKDSIQLDGMFGCLNTLKLKPIPWDICWYMAIVRNNGLAVQSPGALTINNGLYNGTHFSPLNRLLGRNPFTVEIDKREDIILTNDIVENEYATRLLKEFYGKLGKRKRDKILHMFVRTLVFLKITKLLKLLLK